MTQLARSTFCRRMLVLVTLMCFLSACQKWGALESPVEKTLAEHQGKVRFTLQDDQKLVFDSAQVVGDSVFGLVDSDTTSIPLSEVAEAEKRKANWVANGIIIGVVVVGLGIVLYCALADGNSHKCSSQ